jgi:threonine dehydrogenase-like Zn-dependent dehydrogenase
LVATRVGAISPGSERALLRGSAPSVPESQYPHQPGYLNVVTIIDAADRTLLGERGVAVLGHRDFALLPYARFIRMPLGLPDEIGLLGILAADAAHGIDVATVESGQSCLVIGGGILGVLTAWELAQRVGVNVRLVERNPARLALLRRIVFPRPIEVSDVAPSNQLFHTVFECSNTRDGFTAALASARPKGSIVVIADGSHEQCVLTPDFFAKNLYLGKTGSHPNLRSFLNEFFARRDDPETLIGAAFHESIRFEDFPHAYLKNVLAPEEERRGLLPRVLYPS